MALAETVTRLEDGSPASPVEVIHGLAKRQGRVTLLDATKGRKDSPVAISISQQYS